jgi:hypothetical protein
MPNVTETNGQFRFYACERTCSNSYDGQTKVFCTKNGFEHGIHMHSGDAGWERIIRLFAASLEALWSKAVAALATAFSYDIAQMTRLF